MKYIIITIILVVFVSDDSFMFGSNENNLYLFSKYLAYVFLIILFSRTLLFTSVNSLLPLLVMLAQIMLTGLVNMDFSGGYVYQAMTLILAFAISKKIQFTIFAQNFVLVIYYLSIASLAIYALAILYPYALTFVPIITNSAGVRAYNFIICTVYQGDGYSLIRNTGIFREPGVYMIYLNVAIIFCLFTRIAIRKKYIPIFIIALISTMSTGGIICAIGIFGVHFFLTNADKKNSKEKIANYVLLIFIIVTLYFANNNIISDKIFGKISSTSHEFESTLARIASLFVPFYIFLSNPIFGVGLSDFSTDFLQNSIRFFGMPFASNGTATNTISNKFATYGIFFGILFMYSIYGLVKKHFVLSNKFSIYFLFILFIALISNEDMRYSILFNILVFYGLGKNLQTINHT